MLLEHTVKFREIQCEERRHEGRVELRPRAAADFGNHLLPRHGGAVGAIGTHRVERIRQRQHAADQRDLVAGDLVRVAVAVPAS